MRAAVPILALVALGACGSPFGGSGSGSASGGSGSGGSGSSGTSGDGCPYAVDTAPTSKVAPNGCVQRTRDTSACRDARVAQGLGGAWLGFSCRVTLSKISVGGRDFVQLATDDRPDYASVYYGAGDACYEADDTRTFPDPNDIVGQSILMTAPLSPSSADGTQRVGGGSVGLAVDGVVLFSDAAAPGDDIYQEARSFDRCQGHPQQNGVYHHHAEPYAISQDDDRLVGVMRDGYFIYGRRDPDGTRPGEADGGLSAPYYGHVGTTLDSPTTPVFHYHVHFESNDTESAYFVAPQQYFGTVVGTCSNGASGC